MGVGPSSGGRSCLSDRNLFWSNNICIIELNTFYLTDRTLTWPPLVAMMLSSCISTMAGGHARRWRISWKPGKAMIYKCDEAKYLHLHPSSKLVDGCAGFGTSCNSCYCAIWWKGWENKLVFYCYRCWW